MSARKGPYEVRAGDFCYIRGEPCKVNKVRTACGEYFMAGNPLCGKNKEELNHIVDITETVVVPLVARLRVLRMTEGRVVGLDYRDRQHEVEVEPGPLADNIAALVEEQKPVAVKVININGRRLVVDMAE